MSSRALRRLERERGAKPLEEQEAASSSSDDAPARRRPAFAALAPESDEFSDGDLPEPISDSACARGITESEVSDTHTEKESSADDSGTAPPILQPPEPEDDSEDESEDALLERMLREKMTVQSAGDASAEDQLAALLRVDAAQLDAAAEMRRKLGQAGRAARQPAVGRRPGTRRVPPIVEPRPAWPSTTLASIGLEVRVLERSDASDAEELVLVPSAEYSRAFETLAALVEAADIEGVYELVRAHPAHVDALLVLADAARMDGASDACVFVERALHALDRACVVGPGMARALGLGAEAIGLSSGLLRFPYAERDNRRVHLALARHAQSLVRQGCVRAALQVVRVAWAADPLSDALGTLRMLGDFAAVQASEDAWLDGAHAFLLAHDTAPPSWAFSLALRDRLRGRPEATQRLLGAIAAHPWMVPALADAAGISVHAANWNASFGVASAYGSCAAAGRDAVARLHAARFAPLWRMPAASSWLEGAVASALSTAVARPMDDYWAPDAAAVLPYLRHAALTDLPGVAVPLPAEIERACGGAVRVYNPLPPEDLAPGSSSGRCVIS